MDVSTKMYLPTILFLNGEYWGVYFLTEKYDAEYFEFYDSQIKNKVVVVK